mgnify:CR=1 FL=1
MGFGFITKQSKENLFQGLDSAALEEVVRVQDMVDDQTPFEE